MAANEALTPRVFIVRHGETEWALVGRQTGKTDLDLTPAGVSQVRSTATHLVGPGKLLDPTNLAQVFVSPRKRALQTLHFLLEGHWNGDDAMRADERVVVTEDIAEWDYGDYEGLTVGEIRAGRRERGLDDGHQVWNVWRDGCEGGE